MNTSLLTNLLTKTIILTVFFTINIPMCTTGWQVTLSQNLSTRQQSTPSRPIQDLPVHDLFVDYERVLHVHGILPDHNASRQPLSNRHINRLDTLSNHPWEALFTPISGVSHNSRTPHNSDVPYNISRFGITLSLHDPEMQTWWRNLRPGGINDGAVWQGRGFTSSLSTGMHLHWRFLSASVRPLFILNQNRDFPLSRYPVGGERSKFSYPFQRMDIPQRFGDRPFWSVDAGPSYLKADYRGFEAGMSNQNRWWGPALHYPIIMGNSAPGFPHVFAGMGEPKDIYIGDLEATAIWGVLHESDYFDDRSFNDERFITGLTMSFNPVPVPDLTVGYSRVYYRFLPPEGIPTREVFKVFEPFTKSNISSENNPGGGDVYDQLLSLFGRWVFPGSGFEMYGEWSRNDHAWDLRDALGDPQHSQGYMAGFQKTFTLTNANILAVNAEIVNITANTARSRGQGTYYKHGLVSQGYTQKGQPLGLGMGPGTNSQLLNGKYYFSKGKISAHIRRTAYNNDFLYRSNAMLDQPGNSGVRKYWLHNFELGLGSSVVWFYAQWEAEFGFELMREFNEDYIYKNDQTNLAFHLRLRYRLSPLR